MLLHRRDGMTDLTRKNTEMVAKLGYVVFAPDIFGKTIRPKDVKEMTEQTTIYNKDRALMRARAQAGFDVLRQNPMVDTARIAMVGYCFGGTVAVEFAEAGAPVVGTVTIHGTFRDFAPGGARNIKGRFLILHGAEDLIAPLDEVNTLIKDFRAAKIDWRMELYGGAEHGFSTPKIPGRGTRQRPFPGRHGTVLRRRVRPLTLRGQAQAHRRNPMTQDADRPPA